MELTPEAKEHLKLVANEALTQLEGIATAAKTVLRDGRKLGSNSLATVNTMTSALAVQKLDQISQQNSESYETLAKEPAIARVVVEDDQGKERTYYICRATPVSGFPTLASYRSPAGRLATLTIGDELVLPDETVVTVLERTRLRPAEVYPGWDSLNTIVETEHRGPFTIESLRALLTEVAGAEVADDLVAEFLSEVDSQANIIEGIRRTVITKMGLRDQPILDQYQDEIFRLPLDRRLLILGPPGTGKTTTLIRRLGQKLDVDFLAPGEQRLVETLSETQGLAHANSWLMFTPTELLKQYLKEAFNLEGVPASDQRIRTWHDYRRELGRNTFGVLKTSTGGGPFVMKEKLASLSTAALERPIEWFIDFDVWQRNVFTQILQDAATMLRDAQMPGVQQLAERLQGIVAQADEDGLSATFTSLASELPKVQELLTSLKEASDAKIKEALNLQLNRNRGFIDELALFIDGLQQAQAADVDDTDEGDDVEADDEDDAVPAPTARGQAFNAYMKAVRAHARAAATKRSVSKTGRNGKIIEWLEGRGLAEADRANVGANLLVQANIRRFANPVKRYLDDIPKRYRTFRRERQKADSWYQPDGFKPGEIHPLEVDIVLLTVLRGAAELISKTHVQRNIDSPAWSTLKTALSHYRNQVLVDEATDFSPIQLACMAALTHPRLRSFFACGDFNQRLTTWGARTAGELKWVFADFDIREINVSYRQSKQLNELARAMIRAVGGTEQNVNLPAHTDSNGVAPVLLENAVSTDAIVSWLAQRIREIEGSLRQLPSTAIFVNAESDVGPLADALSEALSEHNIPVIACREGQAVGQESNVRVFDIQHIKGLEFEAVFFIGIDQLAAMHPALFDKYLYVGTTRAATFLGMTCEGQVPDAIESLRAHFGQYWQSSPRN